MQFIQRGATRHRAWMPFRGGSPSVPVGVDGQPLQAVVQQCNHGGTGCSPYGDGTVYGDGELYCSSDGGHGFFFCLQEVQTHILSVRITHTNGTQLIVDTIKPYLRQDDNRLPYNYQTDVDSNCPTHLSLRIQDRSGHQLILYRAMVNVNRRRNRPVT